MVPHVVHVLTLGLQNKSTLRLHVSGISQRFDTLGWLSRDVKSFFAAEKWAMRAIVYEDWRLLRRRRSWNWLSRWARYQSKYASNDPFRTCSHLLSNRFSTLHDCRWQRWVRPAEARKIKCSHSPRASCSHGPFSQVSALLRRGGNRASRVRVRPKRFRFAKTTTRWRPPRQPLPMDCTRGECHGTDWHRPSWMAGSMA